MKNEAELLDWLLDSDNRELDDAIESGFNFMAVIASVGTREYYRARGYKLSGTYMVKRLVQNREK